MSITNLAPELTDAIVDHLHDDPPSLKAMALSCRRFLPASQFHLFTDVDMKSRYFTTHPFPRRLVHLVKRLRLTGDSEPRMLYPWSGSFMGRTISPPPPTRDQLREGLSPFKATELDLQEVKSSASSTLLAAVVTTQNLVDNVTTLRLKNCCIDVEDSLTLACSLPQLRSLRFSALTFDNSRSMIRNIERASMARCWAYNRNSLDWSTISDSVSTDVGLELHEIEVHDMEWTEDVRAMMVSLLDRLVDPSETFTLRANVSRSDLSDEQGHPKGLSPFESFLKECGHKIRRLDLCLGSASTSEKESSALPNCPTIQFGSISEFCPDIDILRLSGSLCSSQVVKQALDSLRPCTRIIGVGDTGEMVDWREVMNGRALLKFASNGEKIVTDIGVVASAGERQRCDPSLTQLREVDGSGFALRTTVLET